jgi:hypothetical protein
MSASATAFVFQQLSHYTTAEILETDVTTRQTRAFAGPRNFCQKTFEKPIDADAGFVVYAPHRMGV